MKVLEDCFDLTMGQSPPGSTYDEMEKTGLSFRATRTSDTGIQKTDDTALHLLGSLVPMKRLLAFRAPVGAINMAWEKCCIGRGITALCHNSGSHSFTYYSALALQKKIQQYEQTGAVFGTITKNQLKP